jgi:hypothetical protein
LWSKSKYNISYSNTPRYSKDFFTEFGKYIKISPSTERMVRYYKHTDKSNVTKYTGYPINLPNGAAIMHWEFFKNPQSPSETLKIKELGGNMFSRIANLSIDINGTKGPNIEGRDIFHFYLSDEGVLYPFGGKDFALFEIQTKLTSNAVYWKNIYVGTKEKNAEIDSHYRTGQLVEEGWKMNY